MDELRTPFFIIATVCVVLIVAFESSSGFVIKPSTGDAASLGEKPNGYADELEAKELQRLNSLGKPPGKAIPQMALLDGLLLFTIGLMGARFFLSDHLSGKIQGIVTLILSLLAILGAVMFIFFDFGQLILMLTLFLAPPFGTVVYVAIWGGFNRGGAQVILGSTMFLKLGFCVVLILAHQRFIQMKGLMLLIATSLVANLIVSFLHSLAPSILVSITDAIAAIVVVVLALIWAVAMLIGGVFGVIKAI